MDEQLEHHHHPVFDNDLLREEIFKYITHDDQPDAVIRNAASFRLVNKACLVTVSRTMLRSKMRLVQLSLNVHDQNAAKNQKLDQFMHDLTTVFPLSTRFTPFAINIHCRLQRAHIRKISNLLIQCGSSLTELHLKFFERQARIFFNFSRILLPNLQKFEVYLVTQIYPVNLPFYPEDKVRFINSVFDASPNIKSFKLHGGCFDNREARSNFGNIKLPPSLTTLNLNTVFCHNSLGILAKIPLPNLTTLNLCIKPSSFRCKLLRNILKKHKKNLLRLCIVNYFGTLKLPIMEKLESLEVDGFHTPTNGWVLQRFVPVLNHLSLLNQDQLTLQKWTHVSCFAFVTSLKLSLDTFCLTVRVEDLKFDWLTLGKIKIAFPSVQKLDICLCGIEVNALKFIILEMRSLQQLRIYVKMDHLFWNHGTVDTWDSIFIGYDEECVAALKEHPDQFDDNMQLRCNSIRDMTELHTLELVGNVPVDTSLISDTTFHFAFFQMPKLRKLILKWCFFTSKEIEEKWKEQGRSIENDIPDPAATRNPVYF